MDDLLEFVKATEQFQRYVKLVETYNNLPTTNPYQSSENYKNDCAGAILEYAKIQPNENEIIIAVDNLIGKYDDAELLGHAQYIVNISKNLDDLVLTGNIDARFDSWDSRMFSKNGSYREIDEPLVAESFTNEFKDMAGLYPTKTK